MEGILTSGGQLERASEYRFDVWCTEFEHEYITVKRGRKKFADKWAIAAGEEQFGRFWDGNAWDWDDRSAYAYRWELEEALVLAKDLAFTANQEKISMMERRFPGEFRGTAVDMAGKEKE